MAAVSSLLVLCSLASEAASQQAGTQKVEAHPPLNFHRTWKGPDDFSLEKFRLTLDSQFRWLHNAQGYNNCLVGAWDATLCPDPMTCAQNCAVDGVDEQTYANLYGISTIPNGVQLKFGSGQNFGSRVYVLDSVKEEYTLFKLKNREFTFDVDLSKVPCTLNAAVYFVEMDSKGSLGLGKNTAGAKFGAGYCDAQCPKNVKFINGEANSKDWNPGAAVGHYGACCAEMDIFEGNANASATTAHPCSHKGLTRCEGAACDTECDKQGCQYEPYHEGVRDFYGPRLWPV